MIRIGYACINTQLPSAGRTCRLRNATEENILALSRQNLDALEQIFEWNHRNGIRLFRISSETVPFGSHPINRTAWWEILGSELRSLGRLIRRLGMRVSMHPGQYTVLNSPGSRIVENSIAELVHHARLLDGMELNRSHKIILHLGGTYGNKPESMGRFVEHFKKLPDAVKDRLVVENDEKSFTAEDVYSVAKALRIPMVFDAFHHACNPSFDGAPLSAVLQRVSETWKKRDGIQKVHYSDPDRTKARGSHSQTIDIGRFRKFYATIRRMSLDVMLEVKDKEQSVLKIFRSLPTLRLTG